MNTLPTFRYDIDKHFTLKRYKTIFPLAAVSCLDPSLQKSKNRLLAEMEMDTNLCNYWKWFMATKMPQFSNVNLNTNEVTNLEQNVYKRVYKRADIACHKTQIRKHLQDSDIQIIANLYNITVVVLDSTNNFEKQFELRKFTPLQSEYPYTATMNYVHPANNIIFLYCTDKKWFECLFPKKGSLSNEQILAYIEELHSAAATAAAAVSPPKSYETVYNPLHPSPFTPTRKQTSVIGGRHRKKTRMLSTKKQPRKSHKKSRSRLFLN